MTTPYHRPIPFDHQFESLDALVAGLKNHDRGQFISACGTGKTYTMQWARERLGARCTLVLVPSLGLIPKFRADWMQAAGQPFAQLCVCSDDSVGRAPTDGTVDEVTFTESELADMGTPVTSDPQRIADFLRDDGDRVIFSTYHSSPLIAQAQADPSVPAFDLVLADEAHRCAGRVDSAFATILDDTRIRARKRLFATATPKIYATRNGDVEMVGMDNEKIFGPVLHKLTFGEAIRRGLLSDYQVVIIGVTDPMIQSWIDAGRVVETEHGRQKTAEDLAMQIGVLKAMEDYGLRRVISFHGRVRAADHFARDLAREWSHRRGTLHTDHISGVMSAADRERKIEQMRRLPAGERMVISNARCLSEGVDIPALDGVVFADPRRSQVDIVQAVGRAIRRSDDKTMGTIVIPVFLGAGDTVDEAIAASVFKPVVDVINALKAHDEDFAATLFQRRVTTGRESSAGSEDLSKIVVDLPANLPANIRARLDEGIRTHLVEQTTGESEGRFDAYFDALLRDGPRFDYNVPIDYVTPDGLRLGQWCSNQRQAYKAGRMPPERQARFEALPGWTWNAQNAQFERMFDALLREGPQFNFNVPIDYVTPDGIRLGQWCSRQRRAFNAGRMPPERQERFEALLGWSWDVLGAQFERMFDALLREGPRFDFNVPVNHITPDGIRLGLWGNTQRQAYKTGRLPPERQARFEALPGWTWAVLDAQFERMFDALLRDGPRFNYKVPTDFETPDGLRLGQWCVRQRKAYNAGRLPPERQARLEALPGWTWDARDAARNTPADDTDAAAHAQKMLAQTREFARLNGHCNVPIDYLIEQSNALWNWITNQRWLYAQGLMSENRRKDLESIPGWSWDDPTEAGNDAQAAPPRRPRMR